MAELGKIQYTPENKGPLSFLHKTSCIVILTSFYFKSMLHDWFACTIFMWFARCEGSLVRFVYSFVCNSLQLLKNNGSSEPGIESVRSQQLQLVYSSYRHVVRSYGKSASHSHRWHENFWWWKSRIFNKNKSRYDTLSLVKNIV